jgi:hypothetical protein
MTLHNIPYKVFSFKDLLVDALLGREFIDKKIVLLVDQVDRYVDARRSFSTANILFTTLADQIRKRGSKMIYTSSTSYKDDWRLGDVTDITYSAQKKHEDTGTSCTEADCMRKHFFKYFVIDNMTHTIQTKRTFEIHNPEVYYGCYESFELYNPADAFTDEDLARTLARIGVDSDQIDVILSEIRGRDEGEEDLDKGPLGELKNRVRVALKELAKYFHVVDSQTIIVEKWLGAGSDFKNACMRLRPLGFEHVAGSSKWIRKISTEEVGVGNDKPSKWLKAIVEESTES